MKQKFAINEIITIVMEVVSELELNRYYELQENEELNLPNPINDKIKKLSIQDYECFMEKITEIAEEILFIKNGELNNLNNCHEEIIFLTKKYFNELS